MELINEINTEIELENKQQNFFKSFLGRTINGAIDIGLRALLPDLIEEQVIDIKNALIENGLQEGINTAINSGKDFVKSFIGIFTGKFENIEQINIATGNGGIVDTISDGLDYSLEKIYDKGYINNTIFSIIKSGKNALLNTIEGNLNKELENQTNIFNQLNTNISEWKEAYNNKNWNLMNKIYENIENNIDKIIPLENLIKEIRKIEDIQNFIKNKGENYEISELEKELIEKFSEIK